MAETSPSGDDREPSAPADLVGPETEDGLRWSRRDMVRWLDPRQLGRTGVRAVVSHAFGQYADRRELQAALHEPDTPGATEEGRRGSGTDSFRGTDEIWIDYIADLGDGFAPTYTQAWLLSRPGLEVASPGDGEGDPGLHRTGRGRVLVMGGDQVYPLASRREYRDRLVGPYRAAFPWCSDDPPPSLYAVPGNHDWYDGLSSFLRLFCQERWIGGWRTRQSRSYFALELPHGWWLLGLDIQLGADMDRPQIEYFHGVADRMTEGDRVVVCSAEPTWLKDGSGAAGYETLAFLERTILPPGARLEVALAGDYHHYARYSDADDRRQRITCGGGGAYLYGTHRLPASVEVPGRDAPEPARRSEDDFESFERRTVYPDAETSRRLRWGALLAPWKNRGFAGLVGVIYLLYAWLLQSASVHPGAGSTAGGGESFMEQVARLGAGAVGQVASLWWSVVAHAPSVAVLSLAVVGACWVRTEPDRGVPRWLRHPVGVAHGTAHLALAVALTWAIARLHLGVFGWGHAEVRQFMLFAAEMVVLGGLLGGCLFGVALLPGMNFNEAYASQHHPGFKSFLRMHIDEDGGLTIYPVGVDEPGRWAFVPEAGPESPRFVPEGEGPEPRLVESPIRIPADGRRRP